MARLQGWLKSGIAATVDHLWPPACACCGGAVDAGRGLCPSCWEAITFLGPPACACCGTPFPYDPGIETLCGDCTRARPPFARARAAFVYDDASRPMILAFKHADRVDLAPLLAAWLMRPAGPLLADADIVAPVPLHWTRLLTRRYNQAAVLAGRLARRAGVPQVPDLLVRHRRTGSQGGKSRRGRDVNVRGAFRVPPRHRARLRDKRVLLIDDVMTTGATAAAASRALLRGGAAAVDVATVARALRAGL